VTSPEPGAEGTVASAAQIDDRLRTLARLSAEAPADGDQSLVDLSASAVTARLLDCAEISALALALAAEPADR
jgi:hypothetical protein